MFNRAGIFRGDQWYQMNQLCSNSPYRNSDFFNNDFFKKPLFRRLISVGIRDPTYLRGKTREMELVTIFTSCHGILMSFFREKLVTLNWLQFLHHVTLVRQVFP